MGGRLLVLVAALGMVTVVGTAWLCRAGGGSGRMCLAAESPGETPKVPEERNVGKIGKITWYRNERRLEVEGRVCMEEGPLEYLAVLKGGKEYESILAFDCSAIDLNIAMIGAGYKAAGGVKKIGDPDTPKGDPVYLYIEWKDDEGKVKRVRAEDLLWNQATKKTMRQTAWVFTGSSFRRDPETKKLYFMAEEERKLIAVYRDPSAMFNSPLDTGQDDLYYIVNKQALPKPEKFACPKHEDVTSPKPGECRVCQGPLFAVGRAVKMILEPAAKDALDPKNLTDGADLVKPGEEDNLPNYKPVPVPGKGGDDPGKLPAGEAPPKPGVEGAGQAK